MGMVVRYFDLFTIGCAGAIRSRWLRSVTFLKSPTM